MSHITLIRHGQANSHATSEAEYDRLSDLGQQQSVWLGAHFRVTQTFHARAYIGTLQRHRETANAMQTGLDLVEDARLNELEYFTMSQAFEAEYGIKAPDDPTQFAHHFPQVLQAWQQDRLEGAPERFAEFEARVSDALREIGQGAGPALVITSGGVISMAMRTYLGLTVEAMSNIALSIMNSSVHRFRPIGGKWAPVLFNAVPHLEHQDRHHAQTHV